MLILPFININTYAYEDVEDSVKLASSSGVLNTNYFEPGNINLNDVNGVLKPGGIIINVIRTIGIIISCITLLILGIKYMIGTVEEKADYKKTMIPYLIGVVILFSVSTILTTIIEMIGDF